jgi:hypothetical protein
VPLHGREHSVSVTLPALSAVFFRRDEGVRITKPKAAGKVKK